VNIEMFGNHSQKHLFQNRLAQVLHQYFAAWEKGDLDLGVATKTLRRWIDGSNSPNDGSMKAFLDAASALRPDFPRDEIWDAFQQSRNGRQHGSLEQDGLFGSDAYDRRFSEWCGQAKPTSKLKICQNWILYPMKFSDEFVWAVNEGAEAQMLLLQPGSSLVEMRYHMTRHSPYSYLAYLEDMPRSIIKLGLDKCENFQLRFYDALPPFAVYSVDDNILFAPFWARHATSEGPHMVMSRTSAFGRMVMDDVDFLWNESPPITISDALKVYAKALDEREKELLREGKPGR
jgi:hypothetical protein